MHYYPEFNKSLPFTIGIEVEFQLLDKNSYNLSPCAPNILEAVPDSFKQNIKPEFIKSMLEVTTGVCKDIKEAKNDLKRSIKELEKIAGNFNHLIFSSSLHPFARCSEQKLSDDKRYHKLMNEFQIVGRRLITQGLHVHIGIDDPDMAINIVDKMRTYIPLLLAISASSPFFEGEDTGLCSFRSKLFDALPRSGIADPLISWENFQVLSNLLYQAGIIHSARDIWWDIRPHPTFGTVEVRICDVPCRFEEIIALAAFIRVLVEFCYFNKKISSKVHRSILLNNKWNACRYGLLGTFVNPFTLEQSTIKEALNKILDETRKIFEKNESVFQYKILKHMLNRGCSASLQRKILKEKKGDFKAMINEMIEGFWT